MAEKVTLAVGAHTYTGQVEADSTGARVPHGLGQLTYQNGDVLEGDFKLGVPHGSGLLRETNGCVYEGAFRNGEADGVVRVV